MLLQDLRVPILFSYVHSDFGSPTQKPAVKVNMVVNANVKMKATFVVFFFAGY